MRDENVLGDILRSTSTTICSQDGHLDLVFVWDSNIKKWISKPVIR